MLSQLRLQFGHSQRFVNPLGADGACDLPRPRLLGPGAFGKLDGLSHRDPVKIRVPIRLAVVRVPSFPDRQEHFLMYVLRFLHIAQNPHGGVEHLRTAIVD
jgi:hypothetical protein